MFDQARARGGRVRHAVDVRVFTSCRLAGRASGGTADTLTCWGELGEHERAHGLPSLDGVVSGKAGPLLSFAQLAGDLRRAQALIRQRRLRLRPAA